MAGATFNPLHTQTSSTFCVSFLQTKPCSCKRSDWARGQTQGQLAAPVPVAVSLPVPDEGGQVAGELLLAGRHRGGPGPEGGQALPGVHAADALGTGQDMSDPSTSESINPPRGDLGLPRTPSAIPTAAPCWPRPPCSGVLLAQGNCTRGFRWPTSSVRFVGITKSYKQILSLAGFLYLEGTREFLTSLSQSRSMSTGE